MYIELTLSALTAFTPTIIEPFIHYVFEEEKALGVEGRNAEVLYLSFSFFLPLLCGYINIFLS